MKPTVGRIVHYVSYGTPNGEYQPEHRAAIITGVTGASKRIEDAETWQDIIRDNNTVRYVVHLCVLNPEGLFFNKHVLQDEEGKAGGTWHWTERDDD